MAANEVRCSTTLLQRRGETSGAIFDIKFRSPHVYPTGTLALMKDSGLRIRIERDLREKFLEICKEQDRPAAQVIREFMRAYISEHQHNNRNDKNKKVSG